MKVFVSRDIPEIGIDMLINEGMEVEVWYAYDLISQEKLVEKAKQADALLCTSFDKIDRNFLTQCRHLKIISQFSAGYNNIDADAAKELGISLGHAPKAMNNATADVAFMLMITASRKFCHMHKSILKSDWKYFQPKANLGQELNHKTLGIFGLGNIGMEMARRCKGAYKMDTIYCNRTPNLAAEKELGAKRVSFEELLDKSDVLSVHSNLTEETKGKFDYSAFSKMKSTSIFINTSRGKLHVEEDLIRALQEGIIWGAGLDVTNPEPMKPDNPLLFMENVSVTPHIGSATIEARNEMSRLAALNIIEFAKGNEIPNKII